MTTEHVLANAPTLDILDSAISIRTLQLALLQQQYAPTHPLFSKATTATTELVGLNVGGSEFGSDKVTVGDAISVRTAFRPVNSGVDSECVDSRRIICSSVSCSNVTIFIIKSINTRKRKPNPSNIIKRFRKSFMYNSYR